MVPPDPRNFWMRVAVSVLVVLLVFFIRSSPIDVSSIAYCAWDIEIADLTNLYSICFFAFVGFVGASVILRDGEVFGPLAGATFCYLPPALYECRHKVCRDFGLFVLVWQILILSCLFLIVLLDHISDGISKGRI
jgi:hypothetical protein